MAEEILEMRIDSLEDQVESLQKKLDIAVKALKEYETNESYKLCIVYCHYGKPVRASDVAMQALTEIDKVGTSAKEALK